MKKLILLLLFISLIQISYTQESTVTKGMFLGGSFNFHSQNNTYPFTTLAINSGLGGIYSNSTNDIKNTTFAITPYLGKEINTRLSVGLQLDIRAGKYKTDDLFVLGQADPVEFERVSNQIGIGIFTRHIFNPDKQFHFFFQPYLGYNLLQEEERQDSNTTQKEKAHYVELGVDLGVIYNINSKVRATLRTGGLNYINGKWEIEDSDSEKDFSSFRTNINLSGLYFGFEIKI